MPDPTFFATAAAWRAWLVAHHADEPDLLVGFMKVGTGEPSMTWSESVDQALCFGWIDGVRRRIDDASYSIRFTPRKPGSIWSAINQQKMADLEAAGLVEPAGRAAFAARTEAKSSIYAYERETQTLDAEAEAEFRTDQAAWAFFQAQAPWYRRNAVHWVVSAKRPETQQRRLAQLISDSSTGRRLRHLSSDRRD